MLQLIRGTRRRSRKAGSTKQLGQLQLFATGNQNSEITEKTGTKRTDASNRGSGSAPALLPFYLSGMKPLSEMSSGRRD